MNNGQRNPGGSTIRDVARRARVSVSTVSRVLNSDPNVTTNTRTRVEQAIEQLGYRPNLVARSLKQRRSQTIGLIVENIANPFAVDIIEAVEAEAARHDYHVFLGNAKQSFDRAMQLLDRMQDRGVDGIICSSHGRDREPAFSLKLMELQRDGVAVVLVGRPAVGVTTPAILTDEVGSARAATDYLVRLGHRRIGFVGGFPDSFVGGDRQAGYEQSLRLMGIGVHPELIIHANFLPDGGREAARRLLALPDPPTAIFTANDLMAIGVVLQVKEMGLRVPQDLSIVGYDDIPTVSWVEPALTTVRLPKAEVGSHAVRKLPASLGRIEEPPTPDLVVLANELVIRASSGPAPARGGGRAI